MDGPESLFALDQGEHWLSGSWRLLVSKLGMNFVCRQDHSWNQDLVVMYSVGLFSWASTFLSVETLTGC